MSPGRHAPCSRIAVALAVLVLVASHTRARGQGLPARQVTLFGVVATPGSQVVDEALESIASQLRTFKPGHGFRLAGVQSQRLSPGQSVETDFGNGYRAGAALVESFNADGKVVLRFTLEQNGQLQGATIVATPPNQLFFIEQQLPDRSRLLIGIGAR